MEFDFLTTLLIVCPLVFLGGLVDAIAGGGGLITLPAFLIAGVPAHMALGSNKLASMIGTSVSTFRLWRAGFLKVREALPAVFCAFIGSAVGARIALLVPEEVFRYILIVLLPFAAIVVFRKSAIPAEGEEMEKSKRLVIVAAMSLLCGAYDGHYIGAGLVLKNGTKIVRPIIAVVLSILFVKTAWELLS